MNTIEDSINQRIGARIRIERESRGWSLTELAERAGVSRAMIHKIERGESSPTATLLGRLSGAFGISMSMLMARAEMQEGKLLRFADQPVWHDPQSHYLRRHVSPRSDLPIDLVQPLPTCRQDNLSGYSRGNWSLWKGTCVMKCGLAIAWSLARRMIVGLSMKPHNPAFTWLCG